MSKNKRHIVMVNLHEVDKLEEVLSALSQEYVKDCVVYSAEGIISRHKGQEETSSLSLLNFSLSDFLNEPRNQNFLIIAVTEDSHKAKIVKSLKKIQKENRLASSFWFIPIEDYHYHKLSKIELKK